VEGRMGMAERAGLIYGSANRWNHVAFLASYRM
jgi:hypothetical protein